MQPRWMILNGLLCATMTEVPLWSSLVSVTWFRVSFLNSLMVSICDSPRTRTRSRVILREFFMGSDRYCLLDLSTTTQNHHHISHKVHQTLKPTCTMGFWFHRGWKFVSNKSSNFLKWCSPHVEFQLRNPSNVCSSLHALYFSIWIVPGCTAQL